MASDQDKDNDKDKRIAELEAALLEIGQALLSIQPNNIAACLIHCTGIINKVK